MNEFGPDIRNGHRFGFGELTDPSADIHDLAWDSAKPRIIAEVRATSSPIEFRQQMADESFWWQRLVSVIKEGDPDLARNITQPWARDAVLFGTDDKKRDIPGPTDYEVASVPPGYLKYLSPRGTHLGDAAPKILHLIAEKDRPDDPRSSTLPLDLLTNAFLESQDRSGRANQVAILALIAEKALWEELTVDQIVEITLSKRYLRESRNFGAVRGFLYQARSLAGALYTRIEQNYEGATSWQKRRLVNIYAPEKSDLSDAFTR